MTMLVASSIGGAGAAREGRAARVVTGAGAYLKLAVAALRSDADLYGTIATVAGRVRGVIGYGVLIADIAGILRANGLGVRDVLGKEGEAAGGGGQFGKRAARLFHVDAVVFDVVIAEDSDGIDQGVRALRFLHRVGQRAAAGVVHAVGHHQQHFLILRALLQMIEGSNHSVIEGGTATGIDALQGVFHFADVAGEVVDRIQIKIVVEVDDKGLILGIAGFHKSQSGGVYLGPFVAHAAAIVDYQAHAYGHIFLAEDRNLLIGLIFHDVEIALFQAGNELPAIIHDGDVQDDQIYVFLDGIVRRRRGCLRGRRLRGSLGAKCRSRESEDYGRHQRERRSPIEPARSIQSWRKR